MIVDDSKLMILTKLMILHYGLYCQQERSSPRIYDTQKVDDVQQFLRKNLVRGALHGYRKTMQDALWRLPFHWRWQWDDLLIVPVLLMPTHTLLSPREPPGLETSVSLRQGYISYIYIYRLINHWIISHTIYIYIYRERERERVALYICIPIYQYIYSMYV